jgi:diguanylate cyclase (GGDEF)-like protein
LWIGTWLRCGSRVPYVLLVPILVLWTASLIPFPGADRVTWMRTGAYGFSSALGCGLAVWAILRRKPRRNAADRMLAATFAFAGGSELVLAFLPLLDTLDAGQVWRVRASTLPLTLVGLGIFVLQSYALDSIDDLNRRSETDSLTELLNRRAFDERLRRALASAERYRRPLALVIADLDHFKRINDSFGHGSGDEVLKSFATLLRIGSRAVDTVARIGGEEFAIIMPESAAADAVGYAERLRVLTERRLTAKGQTVTASFGVADTAGGKYEPGKLIAAADAALYAAKAGGRNRVCEFAPPPETVRAAGMNE